MKPGLYLVPTPIGNLGDMTFRAIEVLRLADQIWAEDTRNARKILGHFEIEIGSRDLFACHDHNEGEMSERLIELIRSGKVIAYVSDAGMPLISDPGYRLVQTAQSAGLYYTVLPGASSVPTALALSGLPSDRFAFLGFIPNREGKRERFFQEVRNTGMTCLAFESAKRVDKSLEVASAILGAETEVAIVREISKKFEEVIKGSLAEVLQTIEGRELKGEIVLAFAPANIEELGDDQIEAQLRRVMATERMKDAVKLVAEQFDLPRNRVYELALRIRNQD